MLSKVLAAVDACRQFGRDQTRNSVQGVADPRDIGALANP